MVKARHLLAQQRLHLIDMPYDGSCVVWSVLPTVQAALGRATSENEVRQLIVDQLQHPDMRVEIEKDLRQTNDEARVHRRRQIATIEELLDSFREPKAFLPPILVARAVEKLTGGSVELLTIVGEKEIVQLYVSDVGEPFTCRFFFEPTLGHAGLVMPLPRVVAASLTASAPSSSSSRILGKRVEPPYALPIEPLVFKQQRRKESEWPDPVEPIRLVASPSK